MTDVPESDLQLVTLGVYGSTEESFFQTLSAKNVDTFVDVRRHRGLRGKRYRYANSTYLQNKLEEMGIRYVHLKSLSPPKKIREKQKAADKQKGVKKRDRTKLGNVFVDEYNSKVLDSSDLNDFFRSLPDGAEVVALFCVEREPEACHRSLLAQRLSKEYNLSLEHLIP